MPRPKPFRRKVLTKKSKAIEGLDDLVRKFNQMGLGASESDQVYDVLLHGARVLRDEAKDLVAVDPNHDERKSGPHIRDVIFAAEGDPSKDPRGPNVIAGVSQRNLKPRNRAVLLERGTSRTKAQPFWRPALAATRPAIANILASGLKKIIEDAAIK